MQLFDPAEAQSQLRLFNDELVAPQWFGTSGARFTSSRLVPATTTTDQAYPHRVIGKLFFTIPGAGNYVCSASVISYRLIATAGHCVASGRRRLAHEFLVRAGAAERNRTVGRLRLGVRDHHAGLVLRRRVVPNAADYAMIELADKNADHDRRAARLARLADAQPERQPRAT